MSQTVRQPAAAAPPPPAVQPGAVAPAPTSAPAPSASTRTTPQRLRSLSLGVVALGVLVALVGAAVFSYLAYSLHRAEADASQLIRVQQIQTHLLTADAAATNAFLVGGLEPAAQRAAYDDALSQTGELIAQAAEAQPADGEALAALNQQVVDYAAAIEQARANNRQGFPVGAQYLRNASAQLRSDALPITDLLIRANADRAAGELDVSPGYLVVAVLVLVLAALVLASVWMARQFHRTFNVGLVVAGALVLVTLVASLIGVGTLQGQTADLRTGTLARLGHAAGARIAANDAKSNESLTLIARGSGAAFEKAWQTSAAAVTADLAGLGSPDLTADWQRYADVHTAIRKLDDGGQWDQAVRRATGNGADSANTAFATVDQGLSRTVELNSVLTARNLSGLQPGLVVGAVLTLLAGLATAFAGRRGVETRLAEYR